ncbi:MAG: fibronectin type III domain-containing protein [Patescibacteria group bacterium]|nr:fibronectin type III domain-containing protein [Patescibacteria group bacterium]
MKPKSNTRTGSPISRIILSAALIAATALTVSNAHTASAQTAATGTATTTTATSTASTEPSITSVTALPGGDGMSATIMWNTDVNATSQVAYGTSTASSASSTTAASTSTAATSTLPYQSYSSIDQDLVTNHSFPITDLQPGTLYHYQVISTDPSGDTNSSPDETFMTISATSSTSTQTSSGSGSGNGSGAALDLPTLENQIVALQQEVATLEQEVASIMGQLNMSSSTGTSSAAGTSTASLPSNPTITPSSGTFPSGSTVDWNGRGFGHEEQVTVTENGKLAGSAHADGGGNFTTGSMTLPTTPGSYTYSFAGSSGDSASASIEVQ